jgi:alpha-tubulin suppressor-like RCC1 family protein
MLRRSLIAPLLVSTALAAPCAFANTNMRVQPYYPVFAAGGAHAIVVKPDGNTWTWGSNSNGQLGDGTLTTQKHPVSISAYGCAQMGAGTAFSICLSFFNEILTWGKNDKGQLGIGNNTDQSTYSVIGIDENWRAIAAGYDHALAIKFDGTLWAWGNNANGQLGRGNTTNLNAPMQVGSDTKWIAISAGNAISYGLKSDGTLWGWGNNANGAIKTGGGNITSPAQIGGTWIRVAAGGGHVIAQKDDGSLWGWGLNDHGQVGNGTTTNQVGPTQITISGDGGATFKYLAAGDKHSFAIKGNGALYYWGDNTNGALGTGSTSTTPVTRPTRNGTGVDWQYVAAGNSFSLAIKANGAMQTWGINGSGQLGLGDTATHSSPQTPWVTSTSDGWANDLKPGDMGASYKGSSSVRSNGTVDTWGGNDHGELGSTTCSSTITPGAANPTPAVRISGNQWVMTSGGDQHVVALKNDGTIWSWGKNVNGRLGTNSSTDSTCPVQENSHDTKWIAVQARYGNVMGLKSDGTLWSWGENSDGNGGTGVSGVLLQPTAVTGGKRWVAFSVGVRHALAIRSDGTVWAWGDNTSSELGTGGGSSGVPVQVPGLSGAIAVGAGYSTSTVVLANGQAFGWGDNIDGGAGVGTSGGLVATPTLIGSDFLMLAKTDFSTLTTKSGGSVVGWGNQFNGELALGYTGHDDFSAQPSPVTSVGFYGPRSLVGGGSHFMTLDEYGDRFSCGLNEYDQLGVTTQGPFGTGQVDDMQTVPGLNF